MTRLEIMTALAAAVWSRDPTGLGERDVARIAADADRLLAEDARRTGEELRLRPTVAQERARCIRIVSECLDAHPNDLRGGARVDLLNALAESDTGHEDAARYLAWLKRPIGAP